MVISVELAGGAMALARMSGLCAAAPVLGEADVPRGVRLGFAVVVSAALAPLRGEAAAALAATPGADAVPAAALVPALACELALGLAIATAARFALAAVEVAGQLASGSLGLSFAEQYDPRRGASADIGQVLARTLAALAFVAAGGLEALVLAAATPAGDAATLVDPAWAALRLATTAATLGLGLAAPLVLAALLGNLAVALAHRAAAAINVFTVGLAAGLLAAGLALLATSAPMVDGARAAAAAAVELLSEGARP